MTHAVNVLKNVYRWSDQDRYDLIDEIDAEGLELTKDHPDVVAAVPDEDAELRALADAAVRAGLLFASTRDRWLGVTTEAPPAERAPRGALPGEPDQIAAEIRECLARRQIDAALRVLWDAVDAWIDARDLARCRALVAALPPADVDSNVMVRRRNASPGATRRSSAKPPGEELRARAR
jgi:hypothetical protein